MAETNLGRVAIVPKGTYSASVQYYYLDLVYYQGSSYLVHTQPTIGTLPTDTDYFYLAAEGAEVEMRYDSVTDYIQWKLITDVTWNNLVQPADFTPTIVQTIGTSTTDVMSQKAVSNELNTKIAKADILKPTKNLFNKLDIINGYYINTTTGSLDADATSAVSNWVSVDKSKVYYLSGRTANINNVRFKDASGNILPPMQNATTPATNYSKPANTILYVPPTAIAVQFMVKFVGTGSVDLVQLEEGIIATSYIAYGYLDEIKESALPIEVKDIRAKRVGDLLYVAMPFSSTQEIVQKMNVFRNGLNDTLNNNVNFENEYLINKKADITIIGTLLKNSNDDTAPTNLNGSYIGGNHGWNQPQKITKSAHGKTFSDIGKIATDSIGNQFTIIQILDANNFVLCAKNKATDGFTYDFPTPNGTLTFPEGAFSGYTFAGMGNTFDFLKSISRKILINGGIELLDGEEKYADYVDIVDMYDAYDLSTVVERLIANAGTYSSNPDFTAIGADKLFRMNITYRFIGNTCLFSHNFYNNKKLKLSFLPFIQTLPFYSGNLYINKILPLSDGVKTWDFRKGEVWATPPATLLQLAKASWESATNAPDRFIQYTPTYAFATGFVKDKGYQREANSSAGWLHTTRKIYPYGVYVGTITIEPYQSYSAQTYRSYQNRSGYPSGRISKVEWLDNGEYYVMIDWNATTFDTIALPKDVIGKQIQVVEKTSNVSVLSTVAASEISFNAVIDTTNVYGYVVLKIS